MSTGTTDNFGSNYACEWSSVWERKIQQNGTGCPVRIEMALLTSPQPRGWAVLIWPHFPLSSRGDQLHHLPDGSVG